MSSTRYLEIDSTYRNRNMYPYPSDFVMEISQSGQQIRSAALDPVSNAAPLLYWSNSFQETTESNTTTAAITVTNVGPTSQTVLTITAAAGILRQQDNFYNGAVFNITCNAVNARRRIVTYKVINATEAIITIESAFPSDIFTAASGSIVNPTPIATNTASSVIQFFIPKGVDISNYYVGYYIQNLGPAVATEYVQITAYDGVTHLATLSAATVNNWNDVFSINNNFVIRKDIPSTTDDILAISTNGKVIQLALTASDTSDTYVSSFLRMIDPVPTSTGFSIEVAPYAEQRRIVRYIADTGTMSVAQAIGTSAFTLDAGASNVDSYYVGAFLTIAGDDKQILTYDGSTKEGTISGTWAAGFVAGASFDIRSAFLQTAFGTNPSVGQTYEMEMYTRDNFTPFVYTGSLVSVQQPVCYEIELINLILPNTLLQSGGRAVFYPYMYVQLSNVSSGGPKGTIYSNNPNAYSALFRVVVDDTTAPLVSPFIKIDSDGMVQTIKFKPDDSMQFSVRLPSGDLFTLTAQDTVGPSKPNPLVQISAVFSLKRLS